MAEEIVLIVALNPDGSVKMVQNHKHSESGRHGLFSESGNFSASKFREIGDLDAFWKIVIRVDGAKFEVLEGQGYLKRGYQVVRDGFGWSVEQVPED